MPSQQYLVGSARSLGNFNGALQLAYQIEFPNLQRDLHDGHYNLKTRKYGRYCLLKLLISNVRHAYSLQYLVTKNQLVLLARLQSWTLLLLCPQVKSSFNYSNERFLNEQTDLLGRHS